MIRVYLQIIINCVLGGIPEVVQKYSSIFMFSFFLLAAPVVATADQDHWQKTAEEIVVLMDRTVEEYKAGDADKAKRTVIEAYFGVFEDRKMEAAMRMEIGAKHTYKVEKLYGNLRKLIKQGRPLGEIQTLCEEIKTAMRRDAIVLDKAGIPPEVFKVN